MFKFPFGTREELVFILKKYKLLTPRVEKALNQAEKSHVKQKRDNGRPYLTEHIYPMAISAAEKYHDEDFAKNLIITCLLHDVVEDDVTIQPTWVMDNFGKEIFEAVMAVTKNKSDNRERENQEEFFEIHRRFLKRLKKASFIAKITKLEDRLNNVRSIEKINNIPKYLRYTEETKNLFIPFAKEEGLEEYAILFEKELKRVANS